MLFRSGQATVPTSLISSAKEVWRAVSTSSKSSSSSHAESSSTSEAKGSSHDQGISTSHQVYLHDLHRHLAVPFAEVRSSDSFTPQMFQAFEHLKEDLSSQEVVRSPNKKSEGVNSPSLPFTSE